jgi:membrane protein YqaA with SNARE-associated domain
MQDFLQQAVEFIQPFAERLGGPGLALIAFLDSSFLSFPEVADVLVVLLVIEHPSRWLYYAALTTAGSIAGCYALFAIARRGGEALLRRRFGAARLDRALGYFRRYGLLAVIIPSILPPPTPFKIFVVMAGVSGVRRSTFLLAIAIGRGVRYGGEAFLAYKYGAAARVFIRDSGPTVLLVLAGVIALAGLAYVVWRRRSPAVE